MALYKRPNSKFWWMKFTFDGELVQQSTKCSNKRDALTIEAAYRHELALGRIGIEPKKDAPTFEKTVEDFLLWSKMNHDQKPNSFARVKFACEPLKKFFGGIKVDRIEPKNIEKYIFWRSDQTSRKTDKKITRSTINLELIILKIIFKRLVSNGTLTLSLIHI